MAAYSKLSKSEGKTGRGTLYVVSAPSGAGKSSLVNALVKRLAYVFLSVSHTTRPMRPGEVAGEHYHFVQMDEFRKLVAAGDFLEHARVFDNCYGTSRSHVEQQLNRGRDVILEIDWQGAEQVRRDMPDSKGIFIVPPSLATLRQRLEKRAQDSAATIERRMREAINEISHYGAYDYLLVNDDFYQTLEEMCAIFMANRVRRDFQEKNAAETLAALLP